MKRVKNALFRTPQGAWHTGSPNQNTDLKQASKKARNLQKKNVTPRVSPTGCHLVLHKIVPNSGAAQISFHGRDRIDIPVHIMSDNISIEKASAVAKPTKHGGKRTIESNVEKTLCREVESIKQFLLDIRCSCRENCLFKVFEMGEEGVDVIHKLRSSRFAGETCIAHTLGHKNPKAVQPSKFCGNFFNYHLW